MLYYGVFIFQVCANGLVCFRRRYEGSELPTINEYNPELKGRNCLAPYFTDMDLSTSGTVWYQAYNIFDNDADNVIESMRSLVNDTYSIEITPNFVFKATWEEVPLFEGPTNEVYMYKILKIHNRNG